jgi:hypothetical protein
MLQVFHVDVVKVDRDVAVCCNGYTFLLQASVPNVSAVSDGCCTCFILVLHIFPDVAYVFTHMLQVFHLNVHMFCHGYTRIFLVFQTYVANVLTVSDVYCKCVL